MVIFREALRVVAHRGVFAAEWKVKTRRRKRHQFERRGNPKRKIDMLGLGQFRPNLIATVATNASANTPATEQTTFIFATD
jgi:hypothetical protein